MQLNLSVIVEWYSQMNGEYENFGVAEDHVFTVPRAIELCDESNISMLTQKYADKVESILANTECKLILMPKSLLPKDYQSDGKAFLFNDDPKKLLIDFCKEFLAFEAPNSKQNIHPSAVIEDGAKIGANNHIGANVFISKNSEIGDNCSIGQNTVIKNSIIKNNVRIGCNNTIGENGFGYSKLKNNEIEFFPHYGRVLIDDNVHVGNNTCIDRGSLSDTVIHYGVKIDNLVHIAHNVIIGKNSMIIACSMVAGSVVIGENCWVAPSSTIRNALSIGKNATTGLGSTVTKNVENDQVVMGNPAIPFADFMVLRNEQKKTLADKNTKREE